MGKYGFGVDIGGTTIKMGLFLDSGELLEKWEIPTNKENNGASILDDIAAAIKEKIEEKKIDRQELLGVGMDVPGPIIKGSIVNRCINIGWGVVDVGTIFKEKTGMTVKIGNDANVAALGELWQGSAKGCKNIVMLTLGTGVGGGIIINEQMVVGANGAGGEVGHIKVRTDETVACGCGKTGCIEQYASATGIVRMAKEKLVQAKEISVLSEIAELTAKDVFDAAKEKDSIAQEIVEEVGRLLGMAIADITCIVDPEMVVIGGGVSKAGDILLEAVKRGYQEKAHYAVMDTEFTLAELGNDAGIYGSMKMLL